MYRPDSWGSIPEWSTPATRVLSHVRSYEIYVGRSGIGAGSLRIARFPLPIVIPPSAPHSLIFLPVLIRTSSLHNKQTNEFPTETSSWLAYRQRSVFIFGKCSVQIPAGERLLTWLKTFCFSSVPPGKYMDNTLTRPQPLPSRSFSIHQSSHHSTPCGSDADSVLMQPWSSGNKSGRSVVQRLTRLAAPRLNFNLMLWTK
jgi:hypothetical protein